jgi:hypothetical protein
VRNKFFELAFEADPSAASIALLDALGHYHIHRDKPIGALKDLHFDNLIDVGDALLQISKHVRKLREKAGEL